MTTLDSRPQTAVVVIDVHTNLYWAHQDAPGRVAAVAEATDVDFAA